jgi:hypothetical protein
MLKSEVLLICAIRDIRGPGFLGSVQPIRSCRRQEAEDDEGRAICLEPSAAARFSRLERNGCAEAQYRP